MVIDPLLANVLCLRKYRIFSAKGYKNYEEPITCGSKSRLHPFYLVVGPGAQRIVCFFASF